MKFQLTIKNAQQETQLFRRRLLKVIILIIFLSLVLLLRLFYLQVIQHGHFTTLSTTNSIKLLPLPPTRGLIYDRNGVVLADNVPVFSLMVTPDEVKNLKQTISEIGQIIPLSKSDLEAFYRQIKEHRQFEEIPLKIKLTSQDVAAFSVNQFKFPGVTVEAELIREYPMNDAFAHVVGFVGRINPRELQNVDASNYAATNFIGKVGIEKYYEPELHGQVGYKKEEVDARGQGVRTISTTPAIRGDDIYLTIDSKLQLAAEKALDGSHGSVVVIQPSTGQVLALVSMPEYDPNVFVTGITQEDYTALVEDSRHPLYNRSIRGLYPPGSTIKPFIGLAALNTDTVSPDYKIYDPGWFQLPDSTHIYHDWQLKGHGWTNLSKAIIESCDTYFWTVSHLMGIGPIDDILNQFGFGKTTGIEMEEELGGTVPSPAWKEKNVGASWYPGDTILTGFGQGFLQTTPLQLASATATLAERGQKYKPTLVYGIKPAADSLMIQNTPKIESAISMNISSDWEVIINAMQKVITQGTGYMFGKNASYTVAAKTGTAQVISQDFNPEAYKDLPESVKANSVFIAFAPVKDPQIAIAVVVEHSHAAPGIARKVMDAYMTQELVKSKSG